MASISVDWDAPRWLQRFPEREPAWAAARPAVAWNLRGMLRGWDEWPEAMDFLDPASSIHAWKRLETRLYEEAAGGLLTPPEPSPPLRVLDAACGIGRHLLPFARAGHEVHGIDALRPSLEAAVRHLEAAAAEEPALAERVRLTWGDVKDLDRHDAFPLGTYDRVLAIELLCYLEHPEPVLRALAERLRPGGTLVLSVEAWPGALLADPTGLSVDTLPAALDDRVLAVPGERWVRPSDPGELAAILEQAGLEPLDIVGTHYLPDGPLASLLDVERIGEPEIDRAVLALEARLRGEPGLSAVPRAWLATAKRPG